MAAASGLRERVAMATDVVASTDTAIRTERREAVAREIDETMVVARLLRKEMVALLASAATATVRPSLPRIAPACCMLETVGRLPCAFAFAKGKNYGVRLSCSQASQQRFHP